MRYYRKFLETMEKTCKTNLEMIQYCKTAGLPLLGEGSSRIVFGLTDKLALKIARNKAGIEQNRIEVEVWNFLDYDKAGYKKYFAKVHSALQPMNDIFLIMDRANTSRKGIRKCAVALFDTKYRTNQENNHNRRDVLFGQALAYIDLTLDTRLVADAREEQLGTVNGMIKLVDYGLNRFVWNTQYVNNRKLSKELKEISNW